MIRVEMADFRARMTGLRRERMVASARYAGERFLNTSRVQPRLEPGKALPLAGEYFFGGGRRAPVAPLPSSSPLDRWATRAETGLRATWLGHSTVLLEIDGLRVLTDPVWGQRASPTNLAGPRRFQPVPVTIAALPPLDAVIISHDHYDHLCHESVLALARTGVCFYTSLGVGARLETWGVPAGQIVELDWWESATLPRGDLRISAAPSQHFSGRGLRDRNVTLWSSFVLRGARHGVFFSGDTGLTPEYAEIAARLGPFDLVMLEVGAFHPAWGEIHLGPDNALEALALLGGGSFLPVHWGTFSLALHDWDEPAERLVELAPARGVHLVMPRLGEAVEPGRVEQVEPWWRTISALEPRAPRPREQVVELVTVPDPID